MNIAGVRLRDAEINTERIRLLDMEHFHSRVIRDDQIADVRIASGDDAREWRSHTFKRDLLFENTNVGGEGGGISLGRLLVGGCVVGVELGDDAFVPQLLPFVVRNFGQLRASLCERGLGTGLIKLMVKIRCVDLSQQLVLLNVCPDVYVPALEVAVNPRKDTRFLPRFYFRRQHQSIGRGAGSWRNYRYGWYCQLIRIGGGLFTL
jgi:hypothetical protein